MPKQSYTIIGPDGQYHSLDLPDDRPLNTIMAHILGQLKLPNANYELLDESTQQPVVLTQPLNSINSFTLRIRQSSATAPPVSQYTGHPSGSRGRTTSSGSSGSSRIVGIAVSVVAIAVFIGIRAFLSGDFGPRDDIEAAFDEYLEEDLSGETAQMQQYVCDEFRDQSNSSDLLPYATGTGPMIFFEYSFRVNDVDTDGDNATAELEGSITIDDARTLSLDGVTIEMRRENDEWRVCDQTMLNGILGKVG